MNKKNLIVAGGCFWCVEHDLRHAEGVLDVISGYTGDTEDTATYNAVQLIEPSIVRQLK
jgi:peptide-methionine (S)-S-oxide reductase